MQKGFSIIMPQQTSDNLDKFMQNTTQQGRGSSPHRKRCLSLKTSADIRGQLLDLNQPIFVTEDAHGLLSIDSPSSDRPPQSTHVVAFAPALPVNTLGEQGFQVLHRSQASFYAGAMANGISSPQMVIALGRNRLLGSYGSGGVAPAEVEAAITEIQTALPDGPYAVNLLNSPFEPELEAQTVALLLKHKVRTIEASAYLNMTRGLVYYRAAGLSLSPNGSLVSQNHIIAKISRKEIARRFMQPAPGNMLAQLVQEGLITQQQANLAARIPMADDITVEADSGGHTDKRPLMCLLPTMIAECDAAMDKFPDQKTPIRIGAAGGISTPEAALAALMAGAAYVVTGSINQSCVEAATSIKTRQMLAQADMADVIMAPSADMFEMGAKVQVLKRGTMFAMRAAKLYETYRACGGIDEIPPDDRDFIEQKILGRHFEEVWQETVAFFSHRNPAQITRANQDPKLKMALIFRWYLGLSSRWAINHVQGREMDFQVWCGPAMGTFNDWVRNTYLEPVENRHVADINSHILTGAAYLYRLRFLEAQGICVPRELKAYRPETPIVPGI